MFILSVIRMFFYLLGIVGDVRDNKDWKIANVWHVAVVFHYIYIYIQCRNIYSRKTRVALSIEYHVHSRVATTVMSQQKLSH